jgi:hypothetical protein
MGFHIIFIRNKYGRFSWGEIISGMFCPVCNLLHSFVQHGILLTVEQACRSAAATACNPASSRSHCAAHESFVFKSRLSSTAAACAGEALP